MRLILGTVFALAVAGPCAAQAFKVEPFAPAVAMPAPTGTASRPLSLSRLAANIPGGTPWLETRRTSTLNPCAKDEIVSWKEEDNARMPKETLDRAFRRELAAAGYRTAGDPSNLFDSDDAKSDLQMGALITAMRMRVCRAEGFATYWEGAAVMNVEWQIYSVSQAKVLARIATQGGQDLKSKDPITDKLIDGAFADNVRRLTAEQAFRSILGSVVPAATVSMPASITFSARRPSSESLSAAVNSVVTIFAGDGMGSGVVISDDGYVLSNHHVAGSSGKVRIHWADGTDTVGEVIRGDARRDVALIKTQPRQPGLAIRSAPAQLGETVFAVGTPLNKQLANTLTRGIVSATRLVDGLPVIQSDVAVDHGNSGGPLLDEKGQIVALTVSRYEPDNVSHNISFFIPIADALAALGLKPAS